MFKKGLLFTFSGTDGSGKSTQIRLISKYYKKQKIFTEIIWARGGYTNNLQIAKDIFRRIFKKKIPPPGFSRERDELIKNPIISRIWIYFALLDLFAIWVIYIRFNLLMGKYVICDRFIDDTLLDFEINFPQIKVRSMILYKFLRFAIPKASKSFLFYTDVSLSINRSRLKKEPFPDKKEILRWRLNRYLSNN